MEKSDSSHLAEVFVHPAALVCSSDIGAGTRVWAFCNVLEGARVGRNVQLCDRVFVEGGAIIGDDVTVKCGVSIWDGITIEDGVFVGPGVMFTNDPMPRSKRHLAEYPRTVIERYASLGAGSIILPGLRIGSYSMIAAGAVVTRDTASNSLMVGNPARQRGWVCVCGRKLAGEASHRTCAACRRTYVCTQDGLHLESGSTIPWEV
jgi:UDP-2-acetamido-3-amino-2,3-dideoxy-glucuronate N-acetyltransferase